MRDLFRTVEEVFDSTKLVHTTRCELRKGSSVFDIRTDTPSMFYRLQ